LGTLRAIVAQSFVSRRAVSQFERKHLSALGLIHRVVGGVSEASLFIEWSWQSPCLEYQYRFVVELAKLRVS
jgi:hypothetical protein